MSRVFRYRVLVGKDFEKAPDHRGIHIIRGGDARFSALGDGYEDRRDAKIYKVLPQLFWDVEYSLWLDWGYQLPWNDDELIEMLDGHDMALCATPGGSVYDVQGKDHGHLVNAQKEFYEHMPSMPEASCGIILRRHTPAILRHSLCWWEQICKFSSRDMVSFPYACWKTGVEWARIPGKIWDYREKKP